MLEEDSYIFSKYRIWWREDPRHVDIEKGYRCCDSEEDQSGFTHGYSTRIAAGVYGLQYEGFDNR
jgi:hypothetical protein